MLLDLALWLATPAPWRHRRLGYVRESVLLSGRARRCRRAWAPHAARSREAVLAACADLPLRRAAVVLGSGPLADVPLSQLAAGFERVLLVDAVHPLGARLAARRFPNVRLVTADLAGADDPVGALCGGADLTVSANLLTQLPVVPMDRHEARGWPSRSASARGSWRTISPRSGACPAVSASSPTPRSARRTAPAGSPAASTCCSG
ncbi:hypothetical protein [Methylobacterium sp. CCH5-D2]|uniref:hypothetical protein n=1 Tax=Methylobacterium sp. CCH5-D2 TaxID=1768765 RepID=UPI000AB188FB